MNVTSFITTDYLNKCLRQPPKNKAKTKPIQSQTNPIPEKPKMNVTSILTKDYERNDIFAVPENKAKTNPIKPNL